MALWTVALDKDGKQINIENASRREKYTCINCGESMMAIKGKERELHFRHHVVTEQCNHDDWLHKKLLSLFMAHLQSSVFKLSKDLIDSIHEEGIVAYTS